MNIQEFVSAIHRFLDDFDDEVRKFQRDDELPEDLDEAEWFEQLLAFIDKKETE